MTEKFFYNDHKDGGNNQYVNKESFKLKPRLY